MLASCWSHHSSGNFKVSVTLSNKAPTKAEQEQAKATSTPDRDIFFRASHFENNFLEKATGPGGGGRVPKDLQDARLQIQLTVFSHNGGSQTFSPQHDGFFRSGEWNACVLASEGQKALPFLDGGVHVERIESALSEEKVSSAWKHWRAFKRAGVGLDEDVVNLKNQVRSWEKWLDSDTGWFVAIMHGGHLLPPPLWSCPCRSSPCSSGWWRWRAGAWSAWAARLRLPRSRVPGKRGWRPRRSC